jgi:hypothetical protein
LLPIIQITKEESFRLREMIPDVRISITSRTKTHNGKKYYAEETRAVLETVKALRERTEIKKM